MRKLLAAVLSAGVFAGGSTVWADALLINGAGATFPYPIYSKWFDVYHTDHPEIQFNYQSIGSGGGIRQITAKTVDFGASDGPMSDAQLQTAEGWTILHFPTVLGGVVPIYNIPGVDGKINFTQRAISEIFLGKITNWNDPEIQSVNPDIKLPAAQIVVVHRSDGSGTSYCWTDFLSKINTDWKSKVGKGTSVNWPVGLGGKGNEGVAGLVKQTPNSIGYVELIYADQNKITYGRLQNSAGKYVNCTLASVTEAAASVANKMPADFRVSITNPPGADAYPASTFTWLLIYKTQVNKEKGQALVQFLKWMLADGQKYTQDLGYAPLPPQVVEMEKSAIEKIKLQ
jgi:phosphate transport system substrate-binding protein